MTRQEEKQRRAGRWAVKRLRRKLRKIDCHERDRARIQAMMDAGRLPVQWIRPGSLKPWPKQATGPRP